MSSEKEKSLLKSSKYDIDGNSIRAFYDRRGRLVCVVDLTITKFKPNVLLVIDGVEGRKWDDVLANDYGMDLELVRPKKDNKYQKMDVEYDGLDVYDNLIQGYKDGADIKSELKDLEDFQVMAAHRSASERFDAAMTIAETARETIERTNEVIADLRAKIKSVKSKLLELRHNVGRVPTKQSAAKILKAEAQLDVLNDKLKRAKKRLENANRRLLTAEDDMASARAVLELSRKMRSDNRNKNATVALGGHARKKTVDADDIDEEESEEYADDGVDEDYDEEFDEDYDIDSDNSENDEVKPLFDKDPEIIDEKIAFKPIDFDEKPEVAADDDKDVTVAQDAKPTVSFEPPKAIMDVVKIPENYSVSSDEKLSDVFTHGINDEVKYDANVIDESDESEGWQTVAEKTDDVEAKQENANYTEMPEHFDTQIAEEKQDDNMVLKAPEVVQESDSVRPAPGVMPNVESNMVRPALPSGTAVVAPDLSTTAEQPRRPNLLYYVLLVVLIALSVFTLWLYQRSNVQHDVLPVVAVETSAPVVSETVAQPVDNNVVNETVSNDDVDDDPFIDMEAPAKPDVPSEEDKPVITSVVEESVNKIAKLADIDMDAGDVADTDTDVSDVVSEGNDVDKDAAAAVEEESEPDVLSKPEYNVATEEKVFVSDNADVSGGELCEGDVAPDENGCCPGEKYADIDGQKACCPEAGGDCFPPMF